MSTLTDAALDAVRQPHAFGHTCHNGRWYNHHVGTRSPCPVLGHLGLLTAQITRLEQQVHAAAHDPAAVTVVACALLAGTPLTELSEDEAAGWFTMARQGIEGLAAHLDPDAPSDRRPVARALQGFSLYYTIDDDGVHLMCDACGHDLTAEFDLDLLRAIAIAGEHQCLPVPAGV